MEELTDRERADEKLRLAHYVLDRLASGKRHAIRLALEAAVLYESIGDEVKATQALECAALAEKEFLRQIR